MKLSAQSCRIKSVNRWMSLYVTRWIWELSKLTRKDIDAHLNVQTQLVKTLAIDSLVSVSGSDPKWTSSLSNHPGQAEATVANATLTKFSTTNSYTFTNRFWAVPKTVKQVHQTVQRNSFPTNSLSQRQTDLLHIAHNDTSPAPCRHTTLPCQTLRHSNLLNDLSCTLILFLR